MNEMAVHPALAAFPPLDGAAQEALTGSIGAQEQLVPVLVDATGRLLDGRGRLAACRALGIEPRIERTAFADDGSCVERVIALNLRRRHLDESQRAMVAAKLATLADGQRRYPAGAQICAGGAVSQPEAAELLNVSRRSVQFAQRVLSHGGAGLVQAVERQQVTVSAAAQASRMEPHQREMFLARVIEGGRVAPVALKEVQREIRLSAIAAHHGGRARAMPGAASGDQRRWPVLYADPPWSWDTWGPAGRQKAPGNHYPTMPLPAIRGLPIAAEVAARDAVLFLWAVAAMTPEALEVMGAWGFRYVSQIVWDKGAPGPGHWVRTQHELLLIGTRGAIPAPAPGQQPSSVIQAARGRHSEKPGVFRGIIAGLYPGLPKLELFARGAVPFGWDAWGNEAETGGDGDDVADDVVA